MFCSFSGLSDARPADPAHPVSRRAHAGRSGPASHSKTQFRSADRQHPPWRRLPQAGSGRSRSRGDRAPRKRRLLPGGCGPDGDDCSPVPRCGGIHAFLLERGPGEKHCRKPERAHRLPDSLRRAGGGRREHPVPMGRTRHGGLRGRGGVFQGASRTSGHMDGIFRQDGCRRPVCNKPEPLPRRIARAGNRGHDAPRDPAGVPLSLRLLLLQQEPEEARVPAHRDGDRRRLLGKGEGAFGDLSSRSVPRCQAGSGRTGCSHCNGQWGSRRCPQQRDPGRSHHGRPCRRICERPDSPPSRSGSSPPTPWPSRP